jgi:tryptophanase
MAGRDPKTGKNRHPRFEFVRLALPRLRYTRDNLDLVIEGAERLWKRRRDIHGMMFVKPEPPGLRHFTATYITQSIK